MLQGPAAYISSPVYGQSHYKKFWLKKMATEDDSAAISPPPPPNFAGVNCSALELRGSSPPSAAVRVAVKSADRKVKCEQKSELDYALALGVSVSMHEENDETSDDFNGGEDNKFPKFSPPMAAEPSSSARMCADCKTVKTPLWRNGPQGPKSLCNACGIRYKKLGKRPLTISPPPTPPISPTGKSVSKLNGKRKRETDEVRSKKEHRKKIKALGFGSGDFNSGGGGDRSGAALRRWREVERIRKGLLRYGKLRSMAKDEEEAAVLLMAMSSC